MRRSETAAAGLNYAAAFLFSALLWTAALAIFKIYPFGGRSILITDMGQQYIEFHAALYEAVNGGGSLLYTWNTGLGMNFVGLFAYYLSSPFTLLMFLFERTALPEAVLFILSVKIAAAGLTFSVFLRRAADVKGAENVMFAALYALSAYPVVYCFNIMWLDAFLLLPLVILALIHVVKTGKIAPLTAAFSVLFFSNFYTAYMVGVFSLLILFALLWMCGKSSKENGRTFLRFVCAAGIATGLTAFLTIPTALALNDSQGMLGKDHVFAGMMTDPLSLLDKLSFGAYDSITDTGTPYLYCGILTVGLLPAWLLNSKISRREKIAGMSLIGILVFSMLCSVIDYLWHAAETPVWFPCRYSFVLIFTLLAFASRAISRRDGLSWKRILTGFSYAAILVFTVKIPDLIFSSLRKTAAGNLLITVTLLFFYALLLILMLQKRRWLQHTALILLILCVSAELAGNTYGTLNNLDHEMHFENRADYTLFSEQSTAIKAALKKAEMENPSSGAFYRVENACARNANDGMSAGYHAVSHYSSFSRRETFNFLKATGLFCVSGNKILRYCGSTSALDSVLGVRYVFAHNERRAGYESTGIAANDLLLWENRNALPLAFFADQAVLSGIPEGGSPLETLNGFLSSFEGEFRSYYTPLVVTPSVSGGELKQNGSLFQIISENPVTLSFTINNPRSQHVTFYVGNNFNEFNTVFLNGIPLNISGERLIRGAVELGMLPAGESVVSVTVTGNKWFSAPCAASFDAEEFTRLAESLRQTAPKALTVSQSKWGAPLISGRITAPRDGVLFTSIPADKGWEAQIDGKTVKTSSVNNAFLVLPLSRGEHIFSFRYQPRGLAFGIILSVITAALCFVLLIWRKPHSLLRAKAHG